jgi:D-3-phosphoglycerate dehydrogenase
MGVAETCEMRGSRSEFSFPVKFGSVTHHGARLSHPRARHAAQLLRRARGLVDEAALARALDDKRIAGAAMDVGRATDQMPSLALAARADVLATPHAAGFTPQAIEHQAFDTVRQVAELVIGRMPPHAVNPDAAARLASLRQP